MLLWKQLEKEYILGDYKSVSSFLKDKHIPYNGNTKKSTSGWKNKKVLKEEEKRAKTIEKVIEKKAEKEADDIVRIKSLASTLIDKLEEATQELNKYIIRNKVKQKEVIYDNKTMKPSKETILENEDIKFIEGDIDRNGLKQLTSSLKDLKEILVNKDENSDGSSLADLIQKAYEKKGETK